MSGEGGREGGSVLVQTVRLSLLFACTGDLKLPMTMKGYGVMNYYSYVACSNALGCMIWSNKYGMMRDLYMWIELPAVDQSSSFRD